jgi:hypothetical protein
MMMWNLAGNVLKRRQLETAEGVPSVSSATARFPPRASMTAAVEVNCIP